jgi:hypothetical protein
MKTEEALNLAFVLRENFGRKYGRAKNLIY